MSDIYDRQRKYASLSKELDKLAEMPERTTREDLRKAAGALLDASNDMKQLMNAQPKGCTCRTHEDDDRTWVTYDPQCRDHRHMHEQIEQAQRHYVEVEGKLRASLRLTLVQAALTGAAFENPMLAVRGIVTRALEIADAAIAALAR